MLYNYQGLTDRILSEEEFMEAKKSGKEDTYWRNMSKKSTS